LNSCIDMKTISCGIFFFVLVFVMPQSVADGLGATYRCPVYDDQHKYSLESCADGPVAPVEFVLVDPANELNKHAAGQMPDQDSYMRYTVSDDGCVLSESVNLSYMKSETTVPLAEVDLIYIEGFHSHNPGSLMFSCRGDVKCIDSDSLEDEARYVSKDGHMHIAQMAKSDAWVSNVGASLFLNIAKCTQKQ